MQLRPIQMAAMGLVGCIFITMVMGAYVVAIGAGMACPDWGTCKDGHVFPMDAAGVAAEVLHRIAALGVVAVGLALLFLEVKDHRKERKLLLTTLLVAGVVGVQILLGALTIWSVLNPLVVTAHQTTAIIAFALSIRIASMVWGLPPPKAAAAGESQGSGEPDAAKSG